MGTIGITEIILTPFLLFIGVVIGMKLKYMNENWGQATNRAMLLVQDMINRITGGK